MDERKPALLNAQDSDANENETADSFARTCGTCLWFAKEPFKRHAGACLNYRENGKYTQSSDVQSCDHYQPRTDSLEQVAIGMYEYIRDMNSPCIRTRWDATEHFKQRLESLGIEL